MAITLQNLIDTAVMLSGLDRPGLSTEAMKLMPVVIYRVAGRMAADESTRHLVTVRETFVSASGVISVGANVLIRHLKHASLEDTADPTFAKKMRFIADWSEFTRPLDSTYGYFIGIVAAGLPKIIFTAPGTPYSPTTGPTMSIDLVTPCAPTVPTTPAGTFTAPLEVQTEVEILLAKALQDPSILLTPPTEVVVP